MSDEDDPFAVDGSRAFGSGLVGRPRALRHPRPPAEAAPDTPDTELASEPLLTPEEIVARIGELEPDEVKALLDREQAKRAAQEG